MGFEAQIDELLQFFSISILNFFFKVKISGKGDLKISQWHWRKNVLMTKLLTIDYFFIDIFLSFKVKLGTVGL